MKQILLLTTLFLTTLGLSAQTVFVNSAATGTGDGTTWDNAYTDLNLAIQEAASGAELRVAGGPYVTPDSTSIFIRKDLAIVGGYEAGNDAPTDGMRTMISGDVLGNDGNTFDSTNLVDNNRIFTILDTAAERTDIQVTLQNLMLTRGAAGFTVDSTEGNAAAQNALFNAVAGGGILSFEQVILDNIGFQYNFAETGANAHIVGGRAAGSRMSNLEIMETFTQRGEVFINQGRGFSVQFTSDIEITNSSFNGGDVDLISGALIFFAVDGVTLSNTTFTDLFSETAGGGDGRGLATYFLDCYDAEMTGCTLTNVQGADRGLGIYLRHDDEDSVSVARFLDPENFVVEDCTFDGMLLGGGQRGATLYTFTSSFTIRNSEFTDNQSFLGGPAYLLYSLDDLGQTGVFENITATGTSTIGGIFTFGTPGDATIIRDSRFADNPARRAGGAYIAGGKAMIDNTVFENNGGETEDAGQIGSAMILALDFDSDSTIISNSTFEGNRTGASNGGAIFIFGTGSDEGARDGNVGSASFVDCDFVENLANPGSNGGAIYLQRAANLDFDGCNFVGNAADDGGAFAVGNIFTLDEAAIAALDTITNDDGTITIIERFGLPQVNFRNSVFFANRAASQGGAISTQRSAVNSYNSIYTQNRVEVDGNSGGAINLNGSTEREGGIVGDGRLTAELVNNTFFANNEGGNDGATGASVSLFQNVSEIAPDSFNLSLTLLNNAFIAAFDDETTVGVESADPIGRVSITSLGGNLFTSDAFDENVAIDSVAAIVNTDVDALEIFADPENEDDNLVPDFTLINPDDNPLIDAGVNDPLVPETGIYGNCRGDMPDIGAAEFMDDDGNGCMTVSTADDIEESGLDLEFFPNPTADYLTIRNNEASIDRYSVIVFDVQGRVLSAAQLTGLNNTVDFTALPAGVYTLQLILDGAAYSKQIVKQ